MTDYQCAIENCNYPVYSGLFCNNHTIGEQNLREKFEQWKVAYDGRITWKEYLHLLAENKISGVGQYIIELTNYHLQNEIEDT